MPRHLSEPAASQAAATTPLFLRLPAVIHMTGLGRSTIYRMVAEQTFPTPVRVGARAVAWRREDLQAWCMAKPTASH